MVELLQEIFENGLETEFSIGDGCNSVHLIFMEGKYIIFQDDNFENYRVFNSSKEALKGSLKYFEEFLDERGYIDSGKEYHTKFLKEYFKELDSKDVGSPFIVAFEFKILEFLDYIFQYKRWYKF